MQLKGHYRPVMRREICLCSSVMCHQVVVSRHVHLSGPARVSLSLPSGDRV